jgi:hypothetical protein
MCEHRDVEVTSEGIDRSAALGQTDCQHSGAPNRINDRANLLGTGLFRQSRQIQTHGGAIKKLGRGRRLPRQLIQNRPRVSRMQSDLDQAHLAETDFNGMLARNIGWFVHQETGIF